MRVSVDGRRSQRRPALESASIVAWPHSKNMSSTHHTHMHTRISSHVRASMHRSASHPRSCGGTTTPARSTRESSNPTGARRVGRTGYDTTAQHRERARARAPHESVLSPLLHFPPAPAAGCARLQLSAGSELPPGYGGRVPQLSIIAPGAARVCCCACVFVCLAGRAKRRALPCHGLSGAGWVFEGAHVRPVARWRERPC